MNALYISYDGASDFVGQSQVLPYIRGLSKSGINVTLLTFEKRECQLNLKEDGINWIPKKYHKHPTIPATLLDVVQGIISGMRVMGKDKIDIIHVRGYIAAVMGYALKYLYGKKIIFDMRGFWPDEKVDAGYWKKGGLLYYIFKHAERIFLTGADEIVVLTESAKTEVSEKYPTKNNITVIPCCVDLSVFSGKAWFPTSSYSDFSNKRVILYTGNLGTFYNLDKIIDFFCFMNRDRNDLFLWVISNYSRDAIREKAEKNGLKISDYRVDTLEYRDMPKVFSRASLSLIFYSRKFSAKGCCPIKLAESLASGVPVVVNSGIGDCDSMVRNKGVGVVMKDFSENEYKRAAGEIDGLFLKMELIRQKCREAAKDLFSLESGIEKYRTIYKRLSS